MDVERERDPHVVAGGDERLVVVVVADRVGTRRAGSAREAEHEMGVLRRLLERPEEAALPGVLDAGERVAAIEVEDVRRLDHLAGGGCVEAGVREARPGALVAELLLEVVDRDLGPLRVVVVVAAEVTGTPTVGSSGEEALQELPAGGVPRVERRGDAEGRGRGHGPLGCLGASGV